MSTPFYTPTPAPVKNTAWGQRAVTLRSIIGWLTRQLDRHKDTGKSTQFIKAFVITTRCAWCKSHLLGPKDNAPDNVSHGICQACADKQKALVPRRAAAPTDETVEVLKAVCGPDGWEWYSRDKHTVNETNLIQVCGGGK